MKKIFLALGILFLVLILGLAIIILKDNQRLKKQSIEIAEKLQSSTPFVIPLPNNRRGSILWVHDKTRLKCGFILFSHGEITGGNTGKIFNNTTFQNGIDVTEYSTQLSQCNSIEILLQANGTPVKSSFSVKYIDSKIIKVAKPIQWD